METENHIDVGAMKKRRVLMADERRYLIYFTFEKSELPAAAGGFSIDSGDAKNEADSPAAADSDTEENKNV